MMHGPINIKFFPFTLIQRIELFKPVTPLYTCIEISEMCWSYKKTSVFVPLMGQTEGDMINSKVKSQFCLSMESHIGSNYCSSLQSI